MALLRRDRRLVAAQPRRRARWPPRCFVVVGVRSALNLPIDAVPDVTNVQVQVITAAPALSPVEVEQYVTVPVERAMAGIPKVDRGPLDLEVRPLGRHRRLRRRHRHLLRAPAGRTSACARRRTPSRRSTASPEMGPITTGLGEIYQFVVRDEGHSLMQLEEMLDWYIGPQLRTVPGRRRGQQLRRRGQAVPGRARSEAPAGRRALGRRGGRRARARQRQRRRRLHRAQPRAVRHRHATGWSRASTICKSVVVGATPQGVPITVATVGDVRFGPRLRRGAASMDGKGEVVVGVALMLMGENSRAVTERVKAKLAELQPTLPAGHPGRAVLRPLRAGQPHHQHRRQEPARGRGAGDPRAARPARRHPRRAWSWRRPSRSRCCSRSSLMNADRRVGEPDEPRRHRLRPHRRRRGDHRRERRAAAGARRRRARGAGQLSRRGAAARSSTTPRSRCAAPASSARPSSPSSTCRSSRCAGIEGKLFRPMATTVLFALLGAFILSLTRGAGAGQLLPRPRAAPVTRPG